MQQDIQTWPELAIGLYDQLTERNAEITYEFDGMEIGVPGSAEPGSPKASWKVDGAIRVRTRNTSQD